MFPFPITECPKHALVCHPFLHSPIQKIETHNPIIPYSIPEPPEKALKGPSVAYMRGQEGALISPLAKKRMVLGWTYYIFVLSNPNKKLYQFRTELVSWERLGFWVSVFNQSIFLLLCYSWVLVPVSIVAVEKYLY